MKWDNNPYKHLKNIIFELSRFELTEEDAKKITIEKATNSIDKFF